MHPTNAQNSWVLGNLFLDSRGDWGWLTHFFTRIFKLLLHENHSFHFDSDTMQFFIKLLTKKESENILVQLVFL